MRMMAVAVALVLGASGCAHKQLTNKQVASGVVATGAVVGMLVLYGLEANCQKNNAGVCGDPDEPAPWPR